MYIAPMARGRRTVLAMAGLLIAVGAVSGVIALLQRAEPPPARFVGGSTCAQCHGDQHEHWSGSHHDLAMQIAAPRTVLGDFDDATFTHRGVTSRFHRIGDQFYVRTEGPDGRMDDFRITYTFGVDPLQQYLVEFPGGRLQALTIAWDTHREQWFSLYPDRDIAPDDWLHWTQRGQNWNSNCAECHSTNLQKNYDIRTDTYRTTWSEINVSCEACHGPGSRHVEWAEASALTRWWRDYDEHSKGLLVRLRDPDRVWGLNEEGSPVLISGDPDPSIQVQMCAQCHARRGPVSVQHAHGDHLLDHFVPQILQENIYFPDGQILDENFEYGSFVQSKMYHAGVRCTDCHQPHRLTPLATGNTLCVRCHQPARYDTPTHHFHPIGSTGASCVECHMPSRTYMVVDPRRDHSFTIPRPDLSMKIGVPNACTMCHTDQDDRWAADFVLDWYGPREDDEPHHGEIFEAAWAGREGADRALRQLLLNTDRPGYVRASAGAALQGYLSDPTFEAAGRALADGDPLVRTMSAGILGDAPLPQRIQRLAPLLHDPVRAVRHMAARALADAPRAQLTADQAEALDEALGSQLAATMAHADNVAGRLALGALYQAQGQTEHALRAYQTAVDMDRRHIDANMALATLLIQLDRPAEAEPLLARLLEQPRPPELSPRTFDRAQGTVHYQLGLLLGAQPGRTREGLVHLREASRRLPEAPRVHYNLGQMLVFLGRADEAEAAWLRAYERNPQDLDLLFALANFYAEQQRWNQAQQMVLELVALAPDVPAVQNLARRIAEHATAPSRGDP